jgi:hypothetical protein
VPACDALLEHGGGTHEADKLGEVHSLELLDLIMGNSLMSVVLLEYICKY